MAISSANRTGDSMVLTNEEARERLMEIADHLVLHDLDLHAGCQDSIVRPDAGGTVVLRRSSGLAPAPIRVDEDLPPTLALGTRHEATLALAMDHRIYVSQHLGDIESKQGRFSYDRALRRMLELWECEPETVVLEKGHRGFYRALAAEFDAQVVEVSHHHAHVASVLAEYQRTDRVLGVSLDSTHFQFDEELGSGEFLLADAVSSERVGRSLGFRVPGDEAAIRAPWRTAMGFLYDVLGRETAVAWAEGEVGDPSAVRSATRMLDSDSGCRRVNSFGRLYDAAAAVVGVCRRNVDRGEAAARLQGMAGPPHALDDPFLQGLEHGGAGLATIFADLLERARSGQRDLSLQSLAARVEVSLGRWVVRESIAHAREHGVGTIVASGGCLGDPWLRAEFRRRCAEEGLEVLLNAKIPPGDGGLALGQAWVGTHRVLASAQP